MPDLEEEEEQTVEGLEEGKEGARGEGAGIKLDGHK